jgi:hypothetical protein
MHVVIDRTKWGRADYEPQNGVARPGSLLDKHGKMCCLGFVCIQLGLPEEDIEGMSYPYEVAYNYAKQGKKEAMGLIDFYLLTESGMIINNRLSKAAAAINDDHTLTDAQKEEALTKIFSDGGHSIEFV